MSEPGSPVVSEKPVAPWWRRAPRWLLPTLVFGFIGVLTVVSTLFIYGYMRVTEPNRSTPALVVRQFLYAVLDRDELKAGLFVCREWPAARAIAETYPEVKEGIRLNFSVHETAPIDEKHVKVSVRMSYIYSEPGKPFWYEQIEPWSVTVVQQHGWRVQKVNVERP